MAARERLQLKLELCCSFGFIDYIEVFHLHFKDAVKHFILLPILEIKDGALSRIVQFVECLRLFIEVVHFFLVLCHFDHFIIVELSWVRQILQSILACG